MAALLYMLVPGADPRCFEGGGRRAAHAHIARWAKGHGVPGYARIEWAIPFNKHAPPMDERCLIFAPLDMVASIDPPGQLAYHPPWTYLHSSTGGACLNGIAQCAHGRGFAHSHSYTERRCCLLRVSLALERVNCVGWTHTLTVTGQA